jgi:hypothetical protein
MAVRSSHALVTPPLARPIWAGPTPTPEENRDALFALGRAHLARADEQLRRGMEIIARQRELIVRLKASGEPHAEAQRVLQVMMYSQELVARHRSVIIGTLAWLANYPPVSDEP